MYDAFELYSTVMIVLELVTGGSLVSRFSQKGRFSEADAADVIEQVTTGIQFLHTSVVRVFFPVDVTCNFACGSVYSS